MNQKILTTGVAVGAGLAVVALFFIGMAPFNDLSPNAVSGTGLVVQDTAVGTGPAAQSGDLVAVRYTGQLDSGVVFDSNATGEPYVFTLGTGAVIAGWDQGLVGMQVGGKRLLVIPASLGYGVTGYGPIPPDATLIFEVELVDVQPATQ